MNKFRLNVATRLIWLAAKVAPRPMGPIFMAYSAMLEKFPLELAQGRTYGVITLPWSLSAEDKGNATMMQERATKEAGEARKGIETLTRAMKRL